MKLMKNRGGKLTMEQIIKLLLWGIFAAGLLLAAGYLTSKII